MSALRTKIERLAAIPFDTEQVAELRQRLDTLAFNLNRQAELAAQLVEVHERLHAATTELQQRQKAFVRVAGPRIVNGYRDFLARGAEIGDGIQQLLARLEQGGQVTSLDDLRKEIRVGLGTLINTEAGEMRANMEMVAIAYQAAGLLHEAANVETELEVLDLARRYAEIRQSIRRVRLILSTSTPENRRVLVTAMPIMAFGQGTGSIFNLRVTEIRSRRQTAEAAAHNNTLAEALTTAVNALIADARVAVEQASKTLGDSLNQARLMQTTTAVLAILAVLLIGRYYLKRRVIARIVALQRAMEKQARGENSPIPRDGNDEISAMAQALNTFVDQRRKAESDLRRAKENAEQALAEVKTLSGLLPICAHCKKIRDDKGYWNQLEGYFREHSEVNFSHGICPDCAVELYPDLKVVAR